MPDPYRTLAAALVSFCLVVGVVLLAPARHAPSGVLVSIPSGEALPEVAVQLAQSGIVEHPRVFELIVRVLGGSRHLGAGTYRFVEPENVIIIAWRLMYGDFGIRPIRVTFIEGSTVAQMGAVVAQNFPNVSADQFVALAAPEQGYLFPDTYDFLPTTSAGDIVAALQSNFFTRIASITPEIQASGYSFSDIVIVASLVEHEAATPTDRRIVAGILWNRLAIGMALQVDADPATYTTAGLPPLPIDNPSLDSIQAAADPTPTNYLYYLTGTDGQMHYATTFAEHEANVKKYLE